MELQNTDFQATKEKSPKYQLTEYQIKTGPQYKYHEDSTELGWLFFLLFGGLAIGFLIILASVDNTFSEIFTKNSGFAMFFWIAISWFFICIVIILPMQIYNYCQMKNMIKGREKLPIYLVNLGPFRGKIMLINFSKYYARSRIYYSYYCKVDIPTKNGIVTFRTKRLFGYNDIQDIPCENREALVMYDEKKRKIYVVAYLHDYDLNENYYAGKKIK